MIPFCTSSSSGIGESGNCLKKWREPEIGWKDSGSVQAFPKLTSKNGLTVWDYNSKKVLGHDSMKGSCLIFFVKRRLAFLGLIASTRKNQIQL
ncbi:MAG: hypothetical protein ACLR23_24100 [Clostridia bacterium]